MQKQRAAVHESRTGHELKANEALLTDCFPGARGKLANNSTPCGFQKMAKMLGGLATPPGTQQGSLTTKKLHRFSAAHLSASFSRSNSSPIGQPHPASRTSCKDHSVGAGQHSRLGWSPATAEKLSQIQRRVDSSCERPANVCGRFWRRRDSSAGDLL